jgi:hypothetical protein
VPAVCLVFSKCVRSRTFDIAACSICTTDLLCLCNKCSCAQDKYIRDCCRNLIQNVQNLDLNRRDLFENVDLDGIENVDLDGINYFSMALPAHLGPRPLIQFRNHFSQTVGLLGRVIRPSQGRYLHTGQHKHRINVYTYQISMPWVGFEATIPASERAKTVHVLDRAATVTSRWYYNGC